MSRKVKKRNLSGTPEQVPEAYESYHAQISRNAAAEGFVLLKNEGSVLPLAEGSRIALYGAGAAHTIKGGTGSGDVNERYQVSIYKGMKNAGFSIANEEWISECDRVYEEERQMWKEEVLRKKAELADSGNSDHMNFFHAYSSTPFRIPTGSAVTKTDADTAIFVLSRVAGEGADRYAKEGDYYLSASEKQMLLDICTLYEKVIILVNAGGIIDLSFMDKYENIKALFVVSQAGMEGGNAVADVLSGKITPSGKLTDSWAYEYADYPNSAGFSHNNGNVDTEKYEEGIYVGYRYFDSFQVPVRYGFGEGLSYTDFKLDAGQISISKEGTVKIPVTVKNMGKYKGKEVVQVYVSLPVGRLEKECRRLCAFAKTELLEPGSAQTLELSFGALELASYEDVQAAWILEAGIYGIFMGDSLKSAIPIASLELKQDKVLEKVEHICPCKQDLQEISRPLEQRKKWHLGIMEQMHKLPVYLYDLSAVATKTVDYSLKESMEDEAGRIILSLETEKLISLATGDPAKGQGSNLGAAGISVPGSAGETSSCAIEDGIANIVLADGPAGLRLNQFYYVKDGEAETMPMEASLEHGFFFEDSEGKEKYYQYCTAIPVGTLLAQTWNQELLEEVGSMIGEEMEHFGITLWLAPGMNIHRNPLCGRNFEYYSEDPLVSGKMAAAVTRGVQRHSGCGTTIKHFACNNQEDNRMGSDSVVSERALREIYLRGFGIAIIESKPLSIMTSYNLLNGIHTANSYDLCTKAARHEFGFDGVIMTDWTTTENGPDCTAAGCIKAGNDIIMPGQETDHESIRRALEDGSLSLDELRACITRLVRVILKSGIYS